MLLNLTAQVLDKKLVSEFGIEDIEERGLEKATTDLYGFKTIPSYIDILDTVESYVSKVLEYQLTHPFSGVVLPDSPAWLIQNLIEELELEVEDIDINYLVKIGDESGLLKI